MTWQEALSSGKALRGTPNMDRALSFKKAALARMDFVRERMITQEHAVFILQGYYQCIQDQVRCLASLQGYTILTSMAAAEFVKEELNEQEIGGRLAALREIHDATAVMGKEIIYEKASGAIEMALRIIEDLHSLIKTKMEKFAQEQMASGRISA